MSEEYATEFPFDTGYKSLVALKDENIKLRMNLDYANKECDGLRDVINILSARLEIAVDAIKQLRISSTYIHEYTIEALAEIEKVVK